MSAVVTLKYREIRSNNGVDQPVNRPNFKESDYDSRATRKRCHIAFRAMYNLHFSVPAQLHGGTAAHSRRKVHVFGGGPVLQLKGSEYAFFSGKNIAGQKDESPGPDPVFALPHFAVK